MSQKRFKINLSDKKATFTLWTPDLSKKEFPTRQAEFAALENLLFIASRDSSLSDHNIASDLINELDNIKEDITCWIIVQSDLNMLRKGYKQAQGERIKEPTWLKLRHLFNQLENPETYVSKEEFAHCTDLDIAKNPESKPPLE